MKGKTLFFVISDLDFERDLQPLKHLLETNHEVIVVSPYTPFFESHGLEGLDRTIYSIRTSHELKTRKRLLNQALALGIPVIDVGPGRPLPEAGRAGRGAEEEGRLIALSDPDEPRPPSSSLASRYATKDALIYYALVLPALISEAAFSIAIVSTPGDLLTQAAPGGSMVAALVSAPPLARPRRLGIRGLFLPPLAPRHPPHRVVLRGRERRERTSPSWGRSSTSGTR